MSKELAYLLVWVNGVGGVVGAYVVWPHGIMLFAIYCVFFALAAMCLGKLGADANGRGRQ